MTKGQKKLRDAIIEKARVLTMREAIDIYTGLNKQDDTWKQQKNRTESQNISEE